MYFEVFKSKDQWYWRLRAANHKTIATGGEGYDNKEDALHTVNLVRSTTKDTAVKEV